MPNEFAGTVLAHTGHRSMKHHKQVTSTQWCKLFGLATATSKLLKTKLAPCSPPPKKKRPK